jgi:uncharacterized protein (TIGR02145 family)
MYHKNLFFLYLIIGISYNLNSQTICDSEGNKYKYVTIGEQVWMSKDLKSTLYNDGTPIPVVYNDSIWTNLTTGGRRYEDPAIYNWFAVSSGKLCPKGWRVPSSLDWIKLMEYKNLIEKEINENSDKEKVKVYKKERNWISWHFMPIWQAHCDSNGKTPGQESRGGWWSSTPVNENLTIAFDSIPKFNAWSFNTKDHDWAIGKRYDIQFVRTEYVLKLHQTNIRWGFNVKCIKDE